MQACTSPFKRSILRRVAIMVAATAMSTAGLAGRAVAQALADQVPDEAMIYFGWRGTADPGAGYSKSEFKSLLDDSHAREIFNEVLPRVTTSLGRLAGPDAAQAIATIKTIAPAMWNYPTAFYMSMTTNGTNQPMPHVALYCKAGKDALNLHQTIEQLLASAGQTPVPIRSSLMNETVVISIGFDDAAQAIAAGADASMKPLAKQSEFSNALSKCGGAGASPADSMATFYINGEAILAFADKMINQSRDAQLVEHWPKVRQALGLDGFKRLIVTAGFDGKLWSERSFVESPLPRTGLLGMVDAPPFADDELKVVPASAVSLSTFTVDLAKFITDARKTTGEIDADAGVKFDQGLGVVQMYLGKNLVRDILEPLGSHWIMYQDPKIAGTGFASTVIVNKLDDPAKATQGLTSLAIAINNTVNGQLRGQPIEISFRQTKIGELTVNYLAIPLFAPAWTIKDGLLYIGLYPQSVAAAAASHTGGAVSTSILTKPEFVALRKSLGATKTGSISFVDLPQTAPMSYSNVLLSTRLFVGAFDIFGGRAAEPVIPSLEVLMKHVSPAGAVTWSDEQGFYSKSLSPFPGAEALNTGGDSGLSTVIQAMSVIMQANNNKH